MSLAMNGHLCLALRTAYFGGLGPSTPLLHVWCDQWASPEVGLASRCWQQGQAGGGVWFLSTLQCAGVARSQC